ncbi:MAG: ribonuclease III [Bdellovibrionaceae bacterium]|nr:ribonuclease III [Pseudobdellovibrionaceae bacterium]
MKDLEVKLGYTFSRQELLTQAMTHKSHSYENRGSEGNNEKLEFLGDAVIDLVLGEYLMELFEKQDEGALSKKRASLVNEASLAAVAKDLELQNYLRLGKGETQSGGALKPRLLASAWEALAGALFLDAGFDLTRKLVREKFAGLIESLDPEQDYMADFKTRLQELAQKSLKATPVYEIESEEGPPHDRVFVVSVKVNGQELAQGQGRSKKTAEQEAAKIAIETKAWDTPVTQES